MLDNCSEKIHAIISAFGLFCCDKFEETPNEKVSDLSKLTKPYFRNLADSLTSILSSKNPEHIYTILKIFFGNTVKKYLHIKLL